MFRPALPARQCGGNYTLTVTVTAFGMAAPTGSVSFLDQTNGNAVLATDPLDSTTLALGFTAPNTTTATASSPVVANGYPITAAAGTLSATNYAFTFVNGTLTINQATLTVTANNANRNYGAANPVFTASYSGFVDGDSTTVLSGAPSLTTTATASSPFNANGYPIAAAAGTLSAPDYAFTFANGTLTITQAASALSVIPSSASIAPNQSVTLTAQALSTTTGTPTGTVNFYDGTTLLDTAPLNAGVAKYSTSSLTPGVEHALTAVYGGDINFIGSNSGTSVTVGSLDFTVTSTGQTTVNVVPGSAGVFTLQITPTYSCIGSPLTLSASGLPSGASVTFSPSTIPAGCQPQMITATIQTALATATTQPQSTPGRHIPPLALALLLLPLLGAKSMRRAGNRMGRLFTLLLLLGGIAAGTAITGCGSANGFFAQSPESYNVTITATGGGITRSIDVTLQLQ